MTDELTPSLAPPADTDADKTDRLVRAAKAIGEALRPLIDGKVVLSIESMIVVQHPDGKVGCSNSNIGVDDESKEWARRAARQYHSGQLGTPDATEQRFLRAPKKH